MKLLNILKIAKFPVELIGGALVLGLIFMLIIPMPLWLLDAFIAINIFVSALLMMLAMYIVKPVSFTTFPSILLITTILRLAISISTTKQILLQQDAGDIVLAFGSFVVGGNLAVGLIIFLVLTLINFLVVTKGAERVAEVAARFSLDALPGKQMAIDSDLRNGHISVEIARNKREELVREGQLYGAMDGAMKFVKGDAIAGIIILLINLIGGISIGVLQHKMSVGDATHVYSVLTIGDGLISQIPALLIALTAGLVITRVSNGKPDQTESISGDIAAQLIQHPKAWLLTAGGMLCFAVIPGMPTVTFLVIAGITFCCGVFQMYGSVLFKRASGGSFNYAEPESAEASDLREFFPARPYVLHFHPEAVTSEKYKNFLEKIRKIRNTLVLEKGYTQPVFEIDYINIVGKEDFSFSIYEVPYVRGSFSDSMVTIHRIYEEILIENKIEYETARNAHEDNSWLWISSSTPLPDDLADKTISDSNFSLRKLENVLYKNCATQFGLSETRTLMNWLSVQKNDLASELQRNLSLPAIMYVLQNLISERVSLRPVIAIAESLLLHSQYERETQGLTELVRSSLKTHICHAVSSEQGISGWLLIPETEEKLREQLMHTPTESFFSLEPEDLDNIHTVLSEYFYADADEPITLIIAHDLRRPMRKLIQDSFHHVHVISFSELIPDIKINIAGRITFFNDSNEDW